MFENIIGHSGVIERLTADVRAGVLPQAILFSGPEYSGKMSVALELARVLTCEDPEAPWNCGCSSCRKQRLLIHPETLLLGARYFMEEIRLTRQVMADHRTVATTYLFVRGVRKLTRRFDRVLWAGEENRISRIANPLADLEERLSALEPPRELPEEERLEGEGESIVSSAEKLVAAIPSDPIPILHVRNASSWAHLSAEGRNKVVIIENADQLNESGRNALLKTLEEPPAHVYFILTSARRSAMIATILSRVRDYRMVARTAQEERQVIERIFRDGEQPEDSVRSYFLRSTFNYPVPMAAIVSHLLHEVEDEGAKGMAELAEAMQEGDPRGVFRYFCEELTRSLRERLLEAAAAEPEAALEATELLAEINRIVAEHLARVETRNMSPRSTAEALFLALRRRFPRNAVR
ncbi:MAG: hypothetical protein ACOCWS_01130 [Alkalispirochaetaceae bacterium]